MLKRTLLVAVALVATAISYPALSGGQEVPAASTASVCAPNALGQGRTIVHKFYDLKNYKQKKALTPEASRQLETLRDCLGPNDLKALKNYQGDQKERFLLYQNYREVTPFKCQNGDWGYYAIPCYVIQCESHFSWRARNPSGASGVYQIMDGAIYPALSRKDQLQNHRIAHSYYGSRGLSPWVCA